MNFNRANNITGWIVCGIACTVYLMTMEATASFWDCGEFISACYKLQIPHPPGAPLFVLMGRFFIILFGNNPHNAAVAVNSMSAIASGFTILFLFWSITYFARKIIQKKNEALTKQQLFTTMACGVVGALAYTFSDSFWYSAVEGEVYALSSFFTAIVFWSILKWEQRADQPNSDRWLIFIFYMMGLSIGVHLLNLLTIPAIIMVYYFKRYKPTVWGSILAFVIGCTITGIVQKFLIQSSIRGAGALDVYFVNDLGMPFFSGFAFFFILVATAIFFAMRYAIRKGFSQLKVALWSVCFLLLGYSTYLTTMIRSNANPAVDMYNVDNPVSLAGYLGRENYNDWPILYGPDFTDKPSFVENGTAYTKFENKYSDAGKIMKADWANTPSSHFFPRMWDNSNDRQQQECYRAFTGMEEGEAPTMKDNISYFTKYQAGWMYMRYFMWNFAGKQNDLQGFGNVRDSNWVSGISVVDNTLYGNQKQLPMTVREDNKSYNKLFMLPLVLGIAGLFVQYKRKRRDFLVNLLLFFFTGLAIVIYLNQSAYQPRERDYAYVGSFYAFAIWVGLGVIAVKELLQRMVKLPVANYAAAGLCMLAVPVLMASQEWDDHDRSNKTLARDLARNYLESCPPNALLFTAEDNDTYMLWYLQEVEGIRPDVRVVVNTIFASDWYINQLRYKVNKSDPFDVVFTPEQIRGSNRDVVYFDKVNGYDSSKSYDLYDALKNVTASDNPQYARQTEEGDVLHLLPACRYTIPVDQKFVKANGTVQPTDTVVSELQLDISSKRYLFKNDLAMLSVIAANNWKRPICFTSDRELADLGLGKYARQEGMTYRLTPVENSAVNNDVAYHNIMEKFAYGRVSGKRPVYFDEENRRRLNYIRLAHAQVAISLAQAGRKEEARKVLERFDQNVSEKDFPYGMTTNRGNQHDAIASQFLQACYIADDITLAKKVSASIKKDLNEQLKYYSSLGDGTMNEEQMVANAYNMLQGKGGEMPSKQVSFAYDIVSSWQLLQQMNGWEKVQGKL
ncbi:MAG: DUF2723 domain-containing protein [Chitinophagaceae bacterium]